MEGSSGERKSLAEMKETLSFDLIAYIDKEPDETDEDTEVRLRRILDDSGIDFAMAHFTC